LYFKIGLCREEGIGLGRMIEYLILRWDKVGKLNINLKKGWLLRKDDYDRKMYSFKTL